MATRHVPADPVTASVAMKSGGVQDDSDGWICIVTVVNLLSQPLAEPTHALSGRAPPDAMDILALSATGPDSEVLKAIGDPEIRRNVINWGLRNRYPQPTRRRILAVWFVGRSSGSRYCVDNSLKGLEIIRVFLAVFMMEAYNAAKADWQLSFSRALGAIRRQRAM